MKERVRGSTGGYVVCDCEHARKEWSLGMKIQELKKELSELSKELHDLKEENTTQTNGSGKS